VGDVKLAPTLGPALGWRSWGTVAVGVVAAILLAGLAGLGGMLAPGLSRKARLPFGPWLVVDALLGVLVGGEVAGWFQAASLGAR
jgi:leader peptidase (prepilin peptidase) / N-methyltransferase